MSLWNVIFSNPFERNWLISHIQTILREQGKSGPSCPYKDCITNQPLQIHAMKFLYNKIPEFVKAVFFVIVRTIRSFFYFQQWRPDEILHGQWTFTKKSMVYNVSSARAPFGRLSRKLRLNNFTGIYQTKIVMQKAECSKSN